MICPFHHYSYKKITHKAWEAGAIDFDGAGVKILPGVSCATLQRAMLRPVLDLAQWQDATYHWG